MVTSKKINRVLTMKALMVVLMTYKIKNGFSIRQVAGTCVAVPTGSGAGNILVTLSDTAAFLWNLLIEAKRLEDIIARIIEEYEVDHETAIKDAICFIDYLKTNNLLEAEEDQAAY